MGKYSTQFKITAVKDYIDGIDGFRKVAKRQAIDVSLLRRWVASYQALGAAGLRSRGHHYSAAFKLSVIQCRYEQQLSLREVAARFGLGYSSCVGIWERQYYSGGLLALNASKRTRSVTMPKKQSAHDVHAQDDDSKSLEQLKAELEYLRMENAYLKKLEEVKKAQSQSPRPGKKPSP
ncbi:hypothetical protein PS3A_42090 [Pseudomonas sp. 3A(2025)]